jgi:hypothetical protein
MEEDAYGIPKPKDTEVIVPTLLFVPCVGYGPGGYRLGYGGGFYDRTLATLQPKPFTVGLGFTNGYLDDFEPEAFDLPLDAILNDNGVVWPHLREAEVPPAGRTAQAAGLGQGDRPARGDPVRGARRGRQGRHHQALHGAPEPARCARGGAGKAQRGRARPVVLPALCAAPAHAGEIVLFDRSWYNRAGVERVMGFCSDAEYAEFMRQAPEFERHLVRSGVHLIKFWFSVSRKEQRRRFKEREGHPLKQWKLSPIDLASLDKWDDYTRAKEAMFFETDTADSPWTVIKSDCKKRARLNAMRYVLHKLPYTNRTLRRSASSIR